MRNYHPRKTLQSCHHEDAGRDACGTLLGKKVTAIGRVGRYVPGGKASYPSSVLMNAFPARVAGLGELIMVVPTPAGEHNPLVLAAAALVGVDRVFTIGGAQAVAALAYGTQSVPQVDKIVGPGNAYAISYTHLQGDFGRDFDGYGNIYLYPGSLVTDPNLDTWQFEVTARRMQHAVQCK